MQDHEYSVIGHSRSTIGRWLGMLATLIVSLLPAVGIGLSDALTRYGLPEWGKLRCHSNHCRRDLHSYPLVFLISSLEGELYLAHIASAIQEMDSGRQALQDLMDLKRGEVRLGIPPMFGLHYAPGLISLFRQSYPGIVMTVLEGSADEISERLERREIDLALLETRRVSADRDSILLGTDEMLLCMHPNHPFASRPFLTAEDLQDADMVVFDRTFLQRNLLDTFCATSDVTYRIALQSNFVSLVIQAARDQVGMVTLLQSVLRCTPGLVGVPFKPAQRMSFRLCWRSGEYLSLASKQLVELASRADLLPSAE